MYQQQSPALKETNPHGSQAFPCAFYRLKLSGHGILVKHHWHEEVEIIYFPGGTFTLDINMETFDVSSECFYFINPGELHSIRARSKEVSMEYAVVFQPELLCSPFYDTVQTQLVQPLKEWELDAGFTDQDPLAFLETGNNKCGIRRRLHITARQNGKNDHHNSDHGNHGCMFEYKFHLVSSLFSADAFRSAFCFCVCVIFTIAFFAG